MIATGGVDQRDIRSVFSRFVPKGAKRVFDDPALTESEQSRHVACADLPLQNDRAEHLAIAEKCGRNPGGVTRRARALLAARIGDEGGAHSERALWRQVPRLGVICRDGELGLQGDQLIFS
jgi:hypothetical protein